MLWGVRLKVLGEGIEEWLRVVWLEGVGKVRPWRWDCMG